MIFVLILFSAVAVTLLILAHSDNDDNNDR